MGDSDAMPRKLRAAKGGNHRSGAAAVVPSSLPDSTTLGAHKKPVKASSNARRIAQGDMVLTSSPTFSTSCSYSFPHEVHAIASSSSSSSPSSSSGETGSSPFASNKALKRKSDDMDSQIEVEPSVSWQEHFGLTRQKKYVVLAAPAMEGLACNIVASAPHRFHFVSTKWEKFPDGTDNIEIDAFSPVNKLAHQDVILLSSFHNNDVTLSQFSVMVVLLQSFISSLTIVLPFYPVGTMERVVKEGQVATANTYAQLLSNLPSCGRPTRVMIYDLHTLQNRFYLHGNAIASLQSTVPILLDRLRLRRLTSPETAIDCIAFPDDGAAKRFAYFFKDLAFEIVTCGKTRDGEKRIVNIQDGDPSGKNVLIVDDLVQTGGTLYECGIALKTSGAKSVEAFVAHGVFPKESWRRFLKTGDRGCFDRFYLSNSLPLITSQLPKESVFEVLDISRQVIQDLDEFSG